jgi:hypothetical protein
MRFIHVTDRIFRAAIQDAKLENANLPIDTIDLYLIVGSSNDWVHLGSAPLGGKMIDEINMILN